MDVNSNFRGVKIRRKRSKDEFETYQDQSSLQNIDQA